MPKGQWIGPGVGLNFCFGYSTSSQVHPHGTFLGNLHPIESREPRAYAGARGDKAWPCGNPGAGQGVRLQDVRASGREVAREDAFHVVTLCFRLEYWPWTLGNTGFARVLGNYGKFPLHGRIHMGQTVLGRIVHGKIFGPAGNSHHFAQTV